MRRLWLGDAGAADELRRAEELTRQVGIAEPCHIHWAGHALSAYVAADRVDDAHELVVWLDRCAAPLPCRWPRIAAAFGRGLLAARDGDQAGCDEHFATVLALHEEVDLPVHRAEALLGYGQVLRRQQQPARARPYLAEAHRRADAAGAAWLSQRALDELRAAGGRRRPGRSDPSALTEAERRVARLAADGASNAEIARQLHLSVNTVETHLKRAFAKLGVHSRRFLPGVLEVDESA
jgi:DNA-binding CsgD family transcriptional regulator